MAVCCTSESAYQSAVEDYGRAGMLKHPVPILKQLVRMTNQKLNGVTCRESVYVYQRRRSDGSGYFNKQCINVRHMK